MIVLSMAAFRFRQRIMAGFFRFPGCAEETNSLAHNFHLGIPPGDQIFARIDQLTVTVENITDRTGKCLG